MDEQKFIFGKNINTGTNYGHIGDRYEGIKQRVFTHQDLETLLGLINDFQKKFKDRINTSHITIGNPGDKESTIYCQQIAEALKQRGFVVEMMGLMTMGFNNKDFDVSNAPDDTIMVEVFTAPNV